MRACSRCVNGIRSRALPCPEICSSADRACVRIPFLQVLLDHGGIFLDHDAYALTPLDDLRRCGSVVAGFEQEPAMRKLNPGALLAKRNASFLRLWRASWRDYKPAWDYNCCQVAFRLHEAHSQALHSHLRAVGRLELA